jgi:predicted TIM-barrel fold metal-dependent hydrolase
MLDRLNAEVAAAQRDYPDRFVGLAMLPMQDSHAALTVLERAIGELELRGVCVLATIEGRPVGSEETLPVFKRIEALSVPVFLHPGVRTDIRVEGPPTRSEGGIGWMAQTALAALSLVDTGILDACPELVVLHPHLGGVLPYVAGRVERMEPQTSAAALPLSAYLRDRFYVDTVSATPGALDLAIQTYGLDKILFGTDFPFIPMAAGVAYLSRRSEAEAIKANVLPRLELPG